MASEYQPPHPRALTTRANKYKIWEDFTDDLQASISTVLPTSSVKYKKICVLSITWAECDFDAITPETRFIDFVTQKYNWIAERYIIPTKDSSVSPPRNLSNFEMQQSAFCALFDFGRKNSANSARAHETLLIYMYSGHAHLGPSGKSLFWFNRQNRQNEGFDWFSIFQAVMNQPADQLLLLDCCAAAICGIQSQELQVEVLAACGFESQAGAIPGESFTEHLVDTFEALGTTAVNVGQLYNFIHNDFATKNWYATPVWIPVKGKDSVTLHIIPRSNTVRELADLKVATATVPNRVHITVSLDSHVTDVPDQEAWKRWMTTNLPPNIRDIRIEAKIETDSCIVHLSMSPMVWTALATHRPHGSFTFIEYQLGSPMNRPGIAGGASAEKTAMSGE